MRENPKQKIKNSKLTAMLFALFILQFAMFSPVWAQTTAFTYQGSLKDGASAANGNYDFEFKLFDMASAGTQQGIALQRLNVAVANGIFSVSLDFGAPVLPGADRFLDIGVRTAGGGAFTALTPRQKVNSSPYSVKSLNSTAAETAANTTQLGGIAANQYVVITDPRMTDARQPTAGSANYIQNQNAAAQSSSNFNISGTGTANVFDSAAQYNIGGTRVLGVTGTNNLFAGIGAGNSNTAGLNNAFSGSNAGQANTTGSNNAFFGADAGFSNSTADSNAFFGTSAGLLNTTGNFNAFFGMQAGRNNTSGGSNVFFGAAAGRNNTTACCNSFFGTSAGFSNTTGSGNNFFGNAAGFSNTTGFNNEFFGSSAGNINTTGAANIFIGFATGSGNTTGNLNTFVGDGAGPLNATGSNNTLIGSNSNVGGAILSYATALGAGTTVSTSNTLVLGRNLDTVQVPGNLNVTGSFTGSVSTSSISGILPVTKGGTALSSSGSAGNYLRSDGTSWTSSTLQPADIPGGSSNYIHNASSPQASSNFNISGNGVVGENLTASGTTSGNIVNATTQYNIGGTRILTKAGFSNLFAGEDAGQFNTTGGTNSFFGTNAGHNNDSGSNNSFFGVNAGNFNNGNNNTFVGVNSGFTNVTGGNNTIIGAGADVATNNLNYATAIGSGAIVSTSNTIVLGRSAGQEAVNVPGSIYVDSGDLNNGTLTNAVLFGNASGEGIASKRTIGGNRFGIDFYTAFVRRMSISQSGVVSLFSLGTTGGTSLCRNASNEIAFCSSSLRYKTNIGGFGAGMSFVNQLRPITFDWKDGGMKDVGFGAEDIEKIDPRFVTYNSSGEVEGVKYDRLSVAFVNAFKEQQEQIETLQKTNAQQQILAESQQKQNDELRKQVDALKTVVCTIKPDAEICKTLEK